MNVGDLGRPARIVLAALTSHLHDEILEAHGPDVEKKADAWLQAISKRYGNGMDFDWIVDATVRLEDGSMVHGEIRVEHGLTPAPLRLLLAMSEQERALDPRLDHPVRLTARRIAGLLFGHDMPRDSHELRRLAQRYQRFGPGDLR